VLKNASKKESANRGTWITELEKTQREIELARKRFNQATELELIDQCVFELNALQSRYAYFLRRIKEEDENRAYS
jgi:hypothetical protein